MDEARLQELWDHHEIRQLLAVYCHGCDRADIPEMASVYCEDSWDDHGPNKCDGKEFSDLIIRQSLQTSRVVSHQLGQSLINVDGDTAGAETYFIASCLDEQAGGEILNQLGGRYVDTLKREGGKWRIKKRLCVREWSISHTIAQDWLAGAGFIDTQRGPADVSWDVLGRTPSGVPEIA
ncbi:MAG: nuclear transport factor 2 family protein [Novosphingobium sp.]|nr:nuclear transport factor 2 family protein [Novosphingobium sp.]